MLLYVNKLAIKRQEYQTTYMHKFQYFNIFPGDIFLFYINKKIYNFAKVFYIFYITML